MMDFSAYKDVELFTVTQLKELHDKLERLVNEYLKGSKNRTTIANQAKDLRQFFVKVAENGLKKLPDVLEIIYNVRLSWLIAVSRLLENRIPEAKALADNVKVMFRQYVEAEKMSDGPERKLYERFIKHF